MFLQNTQMEYFWCTSLKNTIFDSLMNFDGQNLWKKGECSVFYLAIVKDSWWKRPFRSKSISSRSSLSRLKHAICLEESNGCIWFCKVLLHFCTYITKFHPGSTETVLDAILPQLVAIVLLQICILLVLWLVYQTPTPDQLITAVS